MKALLIRISVGVVALGGLLYFLACSPATNNSNTNQNQNVAKVGDAANTNSRLKKCEYGSDPITGEGLKKKIKDKMSSSLKKELKDETNPNGTFTLELKKPTGMEYFVAYVTGKVSGDDNLKELGDILNDFQDKELCLRIVYLRPTGAVTATTGDGGFEWIACEHPLQTCPNGECAEICPNMDPMPSATPKPDANSNANSNSNANGNRAGNTGN